MTEFFSEELHTAFLTNNATTPDEKRWTCPTCGVIEPRLVTFGREPRYIRVSCPCQVKARREQEQREMQQRIQYQEHHRIYTWLGHRWSDADLKKKTFENFDATRQPEAYQTALDYTVNPEGTLVLYGTFGTGKTHLLAAICNAAYLNHRTHSLFTTSHKLFAAIQYCIQTNEPYADIIDKCIKTPLLVLDDIDKAKWSEFREEIYFEIVDERIKRKKPIAISTNRLESLSDYVGGAVCSRLKVGQIAIPMIGDDYREEL